MNKPTANDWLKVGNDMRATIGLKPLTAEEIGPENLIPSETLLNKYEEIVPGSRQLLVNSAIAEMNHRLSMEKIVK